MKTKSPLEQREASPEGAGLEQAPARCGPQASVSLQRAVGNRAMGRLLGSGLRVSQESDRDEHEADRVARATLGATLAVSPVAPRLQRACAKCEDDEELLRRSSAPASGNPEGGHASPELRSYVHRSSATGRTLDGPVRQSMESAFGQPFGHVRVHTDDEAARAASSIDARAFTLGSSIWFGGGEYRPHTDEGRFLLAHELAHTLQQRGGTMQRWPALGRTDDPAEGQADAIARSALAGERLPTLSGGASAIRRAPKGVRIESGRNANERLVTYEGTTYRVTRTFTEITKKVKQGQKPKAQIKWDTSNIWLEIRWCKSDVKGTFQLGTDVVDRLEDLLNRALTSGGATDLASLLKDTQIGPFLTAELAKSGQWKADLEVQLIVGQGGVQGGGGSISVGTGRYKFSVGVQGTKAPPGQSTPDVSGTLSFSVTDETPQKFKCDTERERKVFVPSYACEVEKQVPGEDIKELRDVPRDVTRTHYLYFEYSEDKFCTKDSGCQSVHATSLEELRRDLAKGFLVTRIYAYTSPEGPSSKSRGLFRGNVILARRRATAAKNKVLEICAENGLDPDGCFAGGKSAVEPEGRGERWPLTKTISRYDPKTKTVVEKEVELADEELPEEVVNKFQASEDEDRHRPPGLDKLPTAKEKVKLIYPLLRRAEVMVSGKETEKKEVVVGKKPATKEWRAENCPDDVEDAADRDFKLKDSLIKAAEKK